MLPGATWGKDQDWSGGRGVKGKMVVQGLQWS